MSGIGRDSDYWGGEQRREIDHFLQNIGIDRNNPIERAGHAIEHAGRGIASIFQGDMGRAQAEFNRAGENFGNVDNYPD